MSDRRVMSQCHSFVSLVVLGQHAGLKCITYGHTALIQIRAHCVDCVDSVLQLMVVWGAKQRFNNLQIKILIFAKHFVPPSKWRPCVAARIWRHM